MNCCDFFFDSFVCEIRKRLIIFDVNSSNWNNTNEILKYQDKLYLSTIIQFDLLIWNHDNSLTNYFEIEKTLELFKRKYYWSDFKKKANIFSEIKQFVKEYCELCAICKKSKTLRYKLYEKFRFLLIFKYKWADIFINFVTELLESKN